MTVPTSDNREQYLGNDSATEFDYAFKIFRADDLVVVLTESDGTETTLTRGTDYSVDGVGEESGGTVTYPLSGDPLATGETLTILREIPVVQETDLRNQGRYYPETLEDEFDRSRMIDQQLSEAIRRTIRVPLGNASVASLPGASDRSKKFLSFDVDGNPTAVVPREDTIDEVSRQLALDHLQSYVDAADVEADRSKTEADRSKTEADRSLSEANRADAEADRAETARDAAFVNADVYPDIATGLAAVADGEQFQVVQGDEIVRYRRDSASTHTAVASYPSATLVNDAANYVDLPRAPARIPGAAIHTDVTSIPSLADGLAGGSNRAYIGWFDVSDMTHLEVTGAREDISAWRWVFYDENLDRVGILGEGNGVTAVPATAKWAGRTVQADEELIELPSFRVRFRMKDGVDARLAGLERERSGYISLIPTFGNVLNVAINPVNLLSGYHRSRSYVGWFDVEDVYRIVVSGDINDGRDFPWVFYDDNWNWLGLGRNGNGVTFVPEGAKWAGRSTSSESRPLPDMSVLKVWFDRDGVAYHRTEGLLRDTGHFFSLEQLPVKGQAAIHTDVTSIPSLADGLAGGGGRAYIGWFDVSDMTHLEVTGAREGIPWPWVFYDENLDRVGILGEGNGVTAVPATAKWAGRTVQITSDEADTELPTFRVKFHMKDGVDARIKELDKRADETSMQVDRVDAMLDAGTLGLGKLDMDQAPISPNQFAGETQHERVMAAVAFIKKRGFGILELGTDTVSDPQTSTWIIESALRLPSNCWLILKGSTLKLADGVFDNIIRNDGIVPDPDPFQYAQELNENRNIKILGEAGASIEGPSVPYTAPHPIDGGDPIPWTGDYYGWRTIGILFANVKGYEIAGFHMTDTTCWAISQENGCEDFEVHDLTFDTSVKNGDGVNCRLGCKNGRIYGISGKTSDDTVALSALKNFVTQHPSGNYVYPMQVGGYGGDHFTADIEDIAIWDVKGRGNHHGVRLLASGGSKLQRITVDDIADEGGSYGGRVLVAGTGYGTAAEMGDVNNIFVNKVRSNTSSTALRIDGPFLDSQFNFIRQANTGGIVVDDSGASFSNTEVTNADYEE